MSGPMKDLLKCDLFFSLAICVTCSHACDQDQLLVYQPLPEGQRSDLPSPCG